MTQPDSISRGDSLKIGLEPERARARRVHFSPLMRLVCTGLLLAACLPSLARAEVAIELGAGVFEPWEGDRGEEYRLAALWSIGSKKRMRIGPEFSFRRFDAEYFGVTDVNVDNYRIGVVFHYRLLPEAVVRPYVGARYNFMINVIDGHRVEREKPGKDVTNVGTGLGLAALFGVDVPIGEHFAFFAESGLSIDLQLTEQDNDFDVENIGGVSGVGGIRVIF